MDNRYSFKEITYLLGCYIVVADNEINEFEVKVLDDYFPMNVESEVYRLRHEIYADDPVKMPLDAIIQLVKCQNYTQKQKVELLTILARTAFADNYVSPMEKEIITKSKLALNYNSDDFFYTAARECEERICNGKLKPLQKIVGKVENSFFNKFVDIEKEKAADWIFGSLGYSATLENITNTATKDLERIIRIVSQINYNMQVTHDKLLSVVKLPKGESKEVLDVARSVEVTAKEFKSIIDISLKENDQVLEKKRRNIQYFTIAFMGRTKAGKSTLHKVITLQNNDDIGVGKLRTTRYNRSWYWDRLRVVDTPGIGAPGGETDTEIAKSIIDEADIICYVVTSDSIQETEFDFFDTIKERNKPLYIILNYKSNLSQEIRLKRFINNPEQWYLSEGPQAIQGHIDRIHDRLDGKYNMNNVEIIPIHLLAAQIGVSGQYDDRISQILIEGSHIMNFIRSIRKEIYNSGCLKKSLSIIDGTAYQIDTIYKSIVTHTTELKKCNSILAQKHKHICEFFEKEKFRLLLDVRSYYNTSQKSLRNYASSFAQNHYDDKNAGKSWMRDTVVKGIYNALQNNIQLRLQDFSNMAKSEVEELASDIDYLFSYSIPTSTNVAGEGKIRNTRLGVGIAGSIVTVVASFAIYNFWNPAGWIAALASAGIGIVISVITSLFKSKQEKIKEATEKMKVQLYTHIDTTISQSSQKSITEINKSVSNMLNPLNNVLTTYIDNVERLTNKLDELSEKCLCDEETINSLVGFRILEYADERVLSDKKIDVMDNDQIRTEFPVKRDWKNQSITFMYPIKANKNNIAKAEKATQMKLNRN